MRRSRAYDKGITLVLVLIIILLITTAGSAFFVLITIEARAAKYRVAAARSELAAHSGLSHAVAVIDRVHQDLSEDDTLIATPDGIWDTDTNAIDPSALSWATFFVKSPGGQEIVPETEFQPYGNDDYSSGMQAHPTTGKRFDIEMQAGGAIIADYAVLIADMDGRLHLNPYEWSLAPGAQDKKIFEVITNYLGLSNPVLNAIVKDYGAEWSSYGEFVAAADLASLDPNAANLLRPYLTPYPSYPPVVARININTARTTTIEAILAEIPSLDAPARAALVNKLVSARPFKGRRQLERAVEELAPSHIVLGEGMVGSGDLTERQFNDVLNSLNSTTNPNNASIFSTDANYTLGDPASATEGAGGVYEFDFDPNPPPTPPQLYNQAGGDKTSDSDVTWGCEVGFASRYYEIIVRSRGWRSDEGKGRAAERLLWAIYDAQSRKILWRRWSFPADR